MRVWNMNMFRGYHISEKENECNFPSKKQKSVA